MLIFYWCWIIWKWSGVFSWDFMKNDPKMAPNVAAGRYLRSTPEKNVWKLEIYIKNGEGKSQAFFEIHPFDGENLGSKGSRPHSQEDPPDWPEGAPWGEVEGECFAPCVWAEWHCAAAQRQSWKSAFLEQAAARKPRKSSNLKFWKKHRRWSQIDSTLGLPHYRENGVRSTLPHFLRKTQRDSGKAR